MSLLADAVEVFIAQGRAAFLVLLVTVFLWFRSKLARQKVTAPIPGIKVIPGAHWLFGHIKMLMGPLEDDKKDYFDHLFVEHANEQGLCCAYYFNPAISVLSAKHTRMILRQTSRRGKVTLVSRHARHTLGQQSLILQSGGSNWKRVRGLVQYALTAEAVKEHNPIIVEVANAMVAALKTSCNEKSNNGKTTVDIVHVAECFTLEAFGKFAFSHNFNCFSDSGITLSREAEAFTFLVDDIPKRSCASSMFNPLLQSYSLPTAYNRRYNVERGIVEKLLNSVIQQSRESLASSNSKSSNNNTNGTSKKTRDNLLTHFIRASEDNSDDALVDVTKTILFAGYETTAITITFVLYNLTKYPEFQELCCEEARRVLQGNNEININDLRYTRAVLMESLRLNPSVIWTSRNLTKTIDLDGYIIPAGFRILLPLTKILVDERNFERGKEFIPTRWVRWNEEKKEWVERDHRRESASHGEDVSAADPANFLAFSDGARDCVGKRLAMNESIIALASLMKHFAVSYDESEPVELKRRLTSWFPHELHLTFSLRDDIDE